MSKRVSPKAADGGGGVELLEENAFTAIRRFGADGKKS